MDIKTNEQFVNLIYPAVIENCKRHGWGVPSAIIGQACLESMKSSGWSGLASTCYNFWGMKWNKKYGCGYKEYKTSEQRADGTYYTVTSKFCKFPTIEGVGGGIDGYFKFIEMNPRYKKVMQCKDFVSYATEIKNCGWATSLKYTQNIINKVTSLNLQRFDTMVVNPTVSTGGKVTGSPYKVGTTYTLQQDLYVRDAPNGNKIKFDSLSENAKENGKKDLFGYGILKKGTRVTCKGFTMTEQCVWLHIPSGWICGRNSKNIYVL